MKTWDKYPERKQAWILLSKLNIEDTYMREDIEGELKQIAFNCKGKNGER